MRLIDADAILKSLIIDYHQPSNDSDDYIAGWVEARNTVFDIISNQPTVYNVDEVIEKLNKTKGMCGRLCCENVIDVVIAGEKKDNYGVKRDNQTAR